MKDIRYSGKLEFIIDNIGFVKVMRNKDFAVPYRLGKEKYSVIVPSSGSMSFYFIKQNETVFLYPGDILYIPKKCPYVAKYLKKGTVMNLFNFDIDTGIIPEKFNMPVKKTQPELARTIDYEAEMYSYITLFLASKIYGILSMLDTSASEPDKKYKKITPAHEALRDRHYENKKLSYYADLCGMSESNFRKLFREYTGKSPIEYRNAIRISHVKRMLESGEYTVSEAAYTVGFNNMSFFYEIYNKNR